MAEEEEEEYVVIELSEFDDAEFLASCDNYTLIGLETEHPMLKIDEYVFHGSWHDTVGTTLLMDNNNPDPDARYLGKSDKKLKFRRVFLESKQPQQPQQPPAGANP
eukprot:TRINITY_DN9268_c0_g1_i1.p2 TRINITY_DN9268_c0_g1~~TRINITY_DN9268_c0_g1_i1.p2  ORF type:complete len:106 (-),score=34.84 TRINITY_DN9268_c0_g1_i1:383-700(-)